MNIKKDDGTYSPLSWGFIKASRKVVVGIFDHNGHWIILNNHRIGSDGTVLPSVRCLDPECDFHEFIKLDDWAAEKQKDAGEITGNT